MNILLPDSWLREYLDTKATPQQIKNCLSLCGPSVERIAKVGTDYIYDIEITSNRIDMASVYGIAREATAILPRFGLKAKLKNTPGAAGIQGFPRGGGTSKNLSMDISDPQKNCNRILGIVMTVDPMKLSPQFMKDRLEKSGVRSLNNLVDITNYVMLEVGHPCHVFDYDRIRTHTFILRRAKKNEPIVTLDGKKYLLCEEDVIIDDGTGRVIDLPGIMGTENSVVTQKTRRIIFFIESNNPVLIRKTSMRYAIRTMAATINEKHPDPETAKLALLRGIDLYQKFAGGKVASKIIDIYPHKTSPKQISVTIDFINERLGVNLKMQEIIDILQSLGFTHNHQPPTTNHQLITVTPPIYRQFDVTIPEDIVEEVARIYGYHNLSGRLMTGEIPVSDKPKILEIEEKIKQMLKYWGLMEIYSYSFISKDIIDKSQLKTFDHLKVANPLTLEIEYMRISLIPSMLETIAKNQFYSDNLRLFELAKIYVPQNKSLPFEIPTLVITDQKDFYKLKGIVEALLSELGISDTEYKIPASPKDFAGTWMHFWHPKQTVSVIWSGKIIGYIGKVHPTISHNFQIKNDLYIAALNVEMLSAMPIPAKIYTPIPTYPAVIEDLTIQYPPETYLGSVITAIYGVSKLVKNVQVIDRYKNSTTLRITYRDEKRNLESTDVKKVREQILQILYSKFKSTLKQ